MNHRVNLVTVLTLLLLAGPIGYGETAQKQPIDGTTQKNIGQPVIKNVLRFGVHVSEMGKLDPHFAAASQDRAFADMVFNGLLRYKPGNAPRIEPDLAQSIPDFTMEEGRQVWRFKLRKGVMFHAGPKTESYELTADDVVYSLKKSADRNRCSYAGEYTGMTIKKIDPHTVEISLKNPLSPILFLPKLTNYNGGFIVSKKAMEAMGDNGFKTHPVGTGPFLFNRYSPGKKLVLKAHKDYFRGRPALDGVEIHFVSDNQKRSDALTSGKLDVIMGFGKKSWFKVMETNQTIQLDTPGVGEVITLYFNTAMAPLNDIRVRKAIAYALDRDAFFEVSAKRLSEKVYSPVPSRFLPGGITKEEIEILGLEFASNLKKARKLLTEAGYPDGFSIDLVSSEKRLYKAVYTVLKQQLSKIGITCDITIKTHSAMHKSIRNDPKPIVLYIAWRPNADVFLTRFFHSNSIIITGAEPDTNFSHYSKIDSLIEAARLETDPEKQTSLWIQSQIKLLNDMAAYPLMFQSQCYARRADVDYGHPLVSTMALYPQFTEKTTFTTLQNRRTAKPETAN